MAIGKKTRFNSVEQPSTTELSPGGLFQTSNETFEEITTHDSIAGQATAAETAARNARGWAIGDSEGLLSGWSATNNAKYYAAQAESQTGAAEAAAQRAAVSAGQASDSATLADGAATRAQASATNATQSEINARASEEAAAQSETNAASSASDAANSASAALASENSARASEMQAAASQVAAANSAADAAADAIETQADSEGAARDAAAAAASAAAAMASELAADSDRVNTLDLVRIAKVHADGFDDVSDVETGGLARNPRAGYFYSVPRFGQANSNVLTIPASTGWTGSPIEDGVTEADSVHVYINFTRVEGVNSVSIGDTGITLNKTIRTQDRVDVFWRQDTQELFLDDSAPWHALVSAGNFISDSDIVFRVSSDMTGGGAITLNQRFNETIDFGLATNNVTNAVLSSNNTVLTVSRVGQPDFTFTGGGAGPALPSEHASITLSPTEVSEDGAGIVINGTINVNTGYTFVGTGKSAGSGGADTLRVTIADGTQITPTHASVTSNTFSFQISQTIRETPQTIRVTATVFAQEGTDPVQSVGASATVEIFRNWYTFAGLGVPSGPIINASNIVSSGFVNENRYSSPENFTVPAAAGGNTYFGFILPTRSAGYNIHPTGSPFALSLTNDGTIVSREGGVAEHTIYGLTDYTTVVNNFPVTIEEA